MSKFSSEIINKYCKSHTNYDNDILADLEKYTWENEDVPQMISGQIVGKLLQFLIYIFKPKKIIEIGTFTGFSALQMAEFLPENGEIHTCEIMEKHAETARKFFNKSEYGKKIKIQLGPALESLEQMPSNGYEMAFIDADKINYLEYYKRCMMLVKKGGIIILDNMLWGGNVIEPKDTDSTVLRKTGDYIQQDKRVFNILLPIRDGLMLCIKK